MLVGQPRGDLVKGYIPICFNHGQDMHFISIEFGVSGLTLLARPD